MIRKRSLPDALRYLAQMLENPLNDAERAGVVIALHALANEHDQMKMTMKPDTWGIGDGEWIREK